MAEEQDRSRVEDVDVKAQERERETSTPTKGQLLRGSCTFTPSMQTVSQALPLTRILRAPAALSSDGLSMATAVADDQLQSITTSPPSKLASPYAHVHSATFSRLRVLFVSAASLLRCYAVWA